jgi:predicted porin
MAGGILFYDDDTDALSTATNIGSVFSNFDGLSRRNRVRYDSPAFWGFQLSGSLLSDGGDVALRYAAKWGEDWKFAAAVAYADPQATSDTVANQYNGSASILHSSGIEPDGGRGHPGPGKRLCSEPGRQYVTGRRPHFLLCQGGLSGQVV